MKQKEGGGGGGSSGREEFLCCLDQFRRYAWMKDEMYQKIHNLDENQVKNAVAAGDV